MASYAAKFSRGLGDGGFLQPRQHPRKFIGVLHPKSPSRASGFDFDCGDKYFMKFILKIGPVAIIVGAIFVFGGSVDDKIATVFGGGLFMALGIAIFQLNKQP